MAIRTGPTAPALRDLQLPERYAIRHHIASGGMASVYCAEDRVLGRAVAIKVLATHLHADEQATQRFMREARAAARVSSHAHVVTVYDVGEAALTEEHRPHGAGPAFIVMEYLPGGTVADALRLGTTSRGESLRWLAEAASALDHAHREGIVHRDVKPANFLLDHARSLHVADFGIARLLSEDTITASGQLFGTAAYVSPEQALGKPGTAASDRYALAVAAFELLVGARPFDAEHFAAQARQHVEEPPPRASERNPALPPAVDRVLGRALAKDPEARYPTAGAFVKELDDALAPPPPRPRRPGPVALPATAATRPLPAAAPAPAPSPSPHAPRRRSARPGRLGALAALALVVIGIAAIAALSSGSHPGATERLGSAGLTGSSAASSHPRRAAKHRRPAAAQTSTGVSSSTPAVSSSTPATAPPATESADQLETQGHAFLQAGNYPAAIADLRRAVAAATPGSLLQGYALYDLGRSLYLSGNPAAAVPVLRQRLRIDDQLPVVRQLLAAALTASGQGAAAGTTSAGKPGKGAAGRGHGHGGGDGGGGGGD